MNYKILSTFPLIYFIVIVYKAYLKNRMGIYLVIKFSDEQYQNDIFINVKRFTSDNNHLSGRENNSNSDCEYHPTYP